MNIVVANGPRVLDNGQETILFPSRWDSGIPNGGKAPFQFYPYELATLSALLKRELSYANVVMLDGNLEGWSNEQYAQEIAYFQPDFIVCELSALTYPTMTGILKRVYEITGKKRGEIKAVLCGPMAKTNSDYELGERANDGWWVCIPGEYEVDVLELFEEAPDEARTEAGLINLDWLPWPEDEDVDRSRYYEINHYAAPAMIQMYPTRGCPLSCTFCVVPTYYGGHGKTSRSHRCRDVENVCDEIEYLAAKYPNFHGCYFNEEAHSANPEWLRSFCEALIRHGLNKYEYDAMCGMWSFDRDLVELCAKAGYKQIRFGMESTSALVGKAIHKTIHKDKTNQFLEWCKEFGVKCYTTIQIGAMGSTEEIDRQTLDDLRAWIDAGMIQKWQISTSTPQPGTPFYEQAKSEGWLVTEDIAKYDGHNAIVSYPNYSAEKIAEVRSNALKGRAAHARKERNLAYLAKTREFYGKLFDQLETRIESDWLDNIEVKQHGAQLEITSDEQSQVARAYGGYEQIVLHITARPGATT